MTFKACHGLVPSYIKDVLKPYEPLCAPQAATGYMLPLPALFLKVTRLSQFMPCSSVVPRQKILGRLTSRILVKCFFNSLHRKTFLEFCYYC